MWSFYADSHKGFCIEYDVEKLVMSEPLRQNVDIVQVLYKKRPPRVSIQDIYSRDLLIAKMFGIKSSKWKYEKEVRLLYNKYGFKRYSPKALKAVYFGNKMPESLWKIIIEGLSGNDVDFYHMERAPGTYRFDAVFLCSNSSGIPELFQTSDYELLSYSKNNIVENFHILFKSGVISREKLATFVKWYRRKYAVKDKSNLFLYDSPSIKKLIDKYPLSEEENATLATHMLAASYFELPDEVQMYPLKNS